MQQTHEMTRLEDRTEKGEKRMKSVPFRQSFNIILSFLILYDKNIEWPFLDAQSMHV